MIKITVRDSMDIKETFIHLLSGGSPRKGLTKKNSYNSIYEEKFSFGDLIVTYYSPKAALVTRRWQHYHNGASKWIGVLSYEPTDTIEHFVADNLSSLRFDILRFLRNRNDRVQVTAHYDD